MSYRADDWNLRGSNCARDNFFVEFPQVFHAPATARDHDKIEGFPIFVRRRQFADRDRDFLRGSGSLDPHRVNQDLQPGRAPFQNVKNIANGRAARGSDDADAAREFRQRAFVFGRK